MKRQIKFRGQDITTKKWVYGSLCSLNWGDNNGAYIIKDVAIDEYEDGEQFIEDCTIIEVDHETVGQYIEIAGKDYYEGDILESWYIRADYEEDYGNVGVRITEQIQEIKFPKLEESDNDSFYFHHNYTENELIEIFNAPLEDDGVLEYASELIGIKLKNKEELIAECNSIKLIRNIHDEKSTILNHRLLTKLNLTK